MRRIATVILFAIVVFRVCRAQQTNQALGEPSLQKYIGVGGGVDEINTGDLTVHISIPLADKGAYGPHATASLDIDSRTFRTKNSSGNPIIYANVGFVFNSSARGSTQFSFSSNGATGCVGTPVPELVGYGAYDSKGTFHPVGAAVNGCVPSTNNTGSDGWTMGVTLGNTGFAGGWLFGATLVSPAGLNSLYNPTQSSSPCPYFYTSDLHSNQISDNLCWTGSNGVITGASGAVKDALGNPALTASLSSNNVVLLQYPGPNSSTGTYKLTFTTSTINQDFGCGLTVPPSYSQALLTGIQYPDGSIANFSYEANPLHAGTVTGRISYVKVPTGAVYTYTYTGGSHGVNCSDGTTSGITKATPDGSWTITHTAYSGAANISTTKIVAPSQDYTVDTISTVPPSPNIFVIPQMSTVATSSYSSAGTLLSSTYTCYNGYHPSSPTSCAAPPSAPSFPKSEMDVWTYVPGVLNPALTITLFDSYSRIIDVKTYDFGGTVGGVNFDTDIQTTYGSWNGSACSAISSSNSYGTYNIVDRVCSTKTILPGGTVAAITYFTYGLSGNSLGEVITKQDTVGGQLVTTETLTYDSVGRKLTSTGPNGETATFTYSQCGGQELSSAAIKTGSAATLTRTYSAYDCIGERATVTTDANGNTSTINFGTDPMWRPASVKDAAGTVTNYTYRPASVSVRATLASQTTIVAGSSCLNSVTQYDLLGRINLSQVQQGCTSSTYTITETDYDSNGRVRRVTLPYSGSAGAFNTTIDGTTYTYDGLDRPLTAKGPAYSASLGGATLTYTYSANDASVSQLPALPGQQAPTRQIEKNGLGQVTSVCEVSAAAGSSSCGQSGAATGFLTQYQYYAGGKLKSITQYANGATPQTRSFTYDNADTGRLLTATMPESGTSTTVYDTDPNGMCPAFTGLPVKTVDNGGGTSCFRYDLADRLASISYFGLNAAVTPTKNFVYDTTSNSNLSCTARNGAGRLVEISTGNSGAATSARGSVAIGGTEEATQTAAATSGKGSITVNGSEQSKAVSASAGFGTVTFVGGPDGSYTFNPCQNNTYPAPTNCPQTVNDGGNIAVTVNGFTENYSFGPGTTTASLAIAFANAFNSASGSPVSASSSGNVLTLTAKTTGSGTNYAFSAGVTTWNSQYFSSPSFNATTSGSTFTGGQNAGTVYDSGTVSATVVGPNGNFTVSVSYGSSATQGSIAVALANGFTVSGSPVSAVASGGTVSLTSLTAGSNTNYSFSATSSSSNGFAAPSFSLSPTSSTLSGGANAQFLNDAGTVSVTVGTFTGTVSYGSGDSARSLASKLANMFNTTSGSPVSASAYGATVSLTSTITGGASDYSYSASSVTNYPSYFATPSFAASTDGSSLAGGANASTLTSDEGFCYDPVGRTTDSFLWTSTGYNAYGHMQETYFNNGLPQSISWSGGWPASVPPTINYTLDAMGRTNSVADNQSHTLVSSTSYYLDDKVNTVMFGNGDKSVYTEYANFSPNAATHYIGTALNNTIAHNVVWNQDGTLQSLQTVDNFNPGNSQSCSFSYDDFPRITGQNCGSNWSESFTYDPFGNVTKSGSMAWPPNGVIYNQFNNQYTAANNPFSYDANGRLLKDTIDTLGWDVPGNLFLQTGTTFVYDALDRPVSSTAAGVTTSYVYAPDGAMMASLSGASTPSFAKVMVSLPASRAVYAGSSFALDHVDHYDWQGTARVASSWARAPYSDTSYDAFGLPYWSSGASNNQFAGLTSDISSGTEQVSATRRYHPTQGRWESPDGLVPNVYNPQTLNAYHYSLNMPVAATDPGGQDDDLTFVPYGSAGTIDNTLVFMGSDVLCGLQCNQLEQLLSQLRALNSSVDAHNAALDYEGTVAQMQRIDLQGLGSIGGGMPATSIFQNQSAPLVSNGSGNDRADPEPQMDLWHSSPQCPNCGQLWKNTDVAVKTFTVSYYSAIGAVLAGPSVAGWAARGIGWTQGLLGTGTGVVLGQWNQIPNYIDAAKQVGANYFNLWGPVYNTLDYFGEAWTANRAFLDASIWRGQQFYLSTSPYLAEYGSGFGMELQHLTSRGIGTSQWLMVSPYLTVH